MRRGLVHGQARTPRTKTERGDDSGRPFADLCISKNDCLVSLPKLPPGACAERPAVVFYAGKVEKCRKGLAERGVTVEPSPADSGGNHLLRFRAREGHSIEVCLEL
jgi:hypothetical protein